MRWLGLTLAMVLAPAWAQPAGVRGACRLLMEQQMPETARADWVDLDRWTVVDNRDGSYSVGVRYVLAARERYVTCIVQRTAEGWRLEKLVRLR